MPLTRRALAALPLLASPALAQPAWPDRPIRLIVPFGPGGAIDTLSRNVASTNNGRRPYPALCATSAAIASICTPSCASSAGSMTGTYA